MEDLFEETTWKLGSTGDFILNTYGKSIFWKYECFFKSNTVGLDSALMFKQVFIKSLI